MPLASLFSLQWYGPAAAAGILQGSAALSGQAKGRARAAATASGVGSVPLAKPTRLVNRPATMVGTGAIVTALPKGRGRMAATIRVNALGQDDVTGAVLEAPLDNGLSVKQALRLILAASAGKLSGAGGGTITLRNPGDTRSRIVATVDGTGNRTAITYDVSDG